MRVTFIGRLSYHRVRRVKISSVEAIRYAPAWDDPFAPIGRVFVVYRVTTDDGLEGIGRGWGDGADIVRELLAPLLIGEDPRDVDRLWARMYTATIGRHGR